MPAVRRHWTTADVRALIDESRPWPRYELIDGELLVTPSPNGRHGMAVTEMTAILLAYLDREKVGVLFLSPSDLELRPGTITQPDVFVVPFGNEPPIWGSGGWSDVGSLLLAIEIISPSSVRTDRVTKRDYYLDVGVPDCFVVDVDARIIECWTQGRDTPLVQCEELVWQPAGAQAPLTVALPALFDDISAKLSSIGIRNR
ncbi:MAG: Uma2 family endonuclease [Gemmatimonadaceae bacterium]